MIIETKFNIGDKIWFMNPNQPQCDTVIRIIVDPEVFYESDRHEIHREDMCFTTKQDLLKYIGKVMRTV